MSSKSKLITSTVYMKVTKKSIGMTVHISRRQFLRGDVQGKHAPIRPPWSQQEDLFLTRCTTCGDCVENCPEVILKKDVGGYPLIDFHLGECSFCEICMESCKSNAFSHTESPWRLSLFISDDCLAQKGVVCSVCAEQCETRAIRFKPVVGSVSVPNVVADLCTGCGACIKPCPETALSLSYQ